MQLLPSLSLSLSHYPLWEYDIWVDPVVGWFDLRCYFCYANDYYCYNIFLWHFSYCTLTTTTSPLKVACLHLTLDTKCIQGRRRWWKKFAFRHRNEKMNKKKRKEEVFVVENHLGIWSLVHKTFHCLYAMKINSFLCVFTIFIVSISGTERVSGREKIEQNSCLAIECTFLCIGLQLENFYDAIISSRDTVRNSNSHWWVGQRDERGSARANVRQRMGKLWTNVRIACESHALYKVPKRKHTTFFTIKWNFIDLLQYHAHLNGTFHIMRSLMLILFCSFISPSVRLMKWKRRDRELHCHFFSSQI